MADYPSGVYSPRTKENKTGVVYDASKSKVGYAEDVTKLDAEVVAIETELGANPKGSDADVHARLDRIEAGRNLPRVVTAASSATPTPNSDDCDLYALTALAAAAEFGAPTGTPVNGQKLIIRIKDNGTARTLTWNAAYAAGGVALPSTTVLGKILHLGFIYNTDNSLNKWLLVASAQEA